MSKQQVGSRSGSMGWFRQVWVTVIGWALTLLGIAALVLPGPGLLLLLAGLIVLSQEYDWARRRVDPVKKKAFAVAAAGVRSYPRIMTSSLGAIALVALGVVWWWSPAIPRWWVLGPRLPFAGWGAGISLIVSGVAALALVGFSVVRFRSGDPRGQSGESSGPPGNDDVEAIRADEPPS